MISPFAGFTIVVVASKKLPVQSLKELIDYAKAHPGKLNYGSVGIGSSQHLAGEYFAQVTGVKITHVPYRNIAQYGPDLIAGTVPLGFQWYPERRRPDRGQGRDPARGRRRQAPCRAAGHADHHRGRPAGIQGCNGWFALLAPAGTPKPILERLNKEMKAALERSAGEEGLRDRRRRADVAAARPGQEIAPR